MRPNLDRDGYKEDRQKDQRSDRVAEIYGHRHRVAAGLAERRGENLDDLESEGDFGNLAELRRGYRWPMTLGATVRPANDALLRLRRSWLLLYRLRLNWILGARKLPEVIEEDHVGGSGANAGRF